MVDIIKLLERISLSSGRNSFVCWMARVSSAFFYFYFARQYCRSCDAFNSFVNVVLHTFNQSRNSICNSFDDSISFNRSHNENSMETTFSFKRQQNENVISFREKIQREWFNEIKRMTSILRKISKWRKINHEKENNWIKNAHTRGRKHWTA